jgi:coenzyme Q-binding protein COQ10
MANIKVRKRIDHQWADLFGLVVDIERYPEFVPCCQRTRVLTRKVDRAGKTVIVSRMTVGVSALRVSYANRTVADLPGRRIKVHAIDGPVRRLDVTWTFNPDGETATDVDFSVSYAFNNPMLGVLASNMFDSMFRQIVDAFEKRADQLFRHGDRPGRKAVPAAADAGPGTSTQAQAPREVDVGTQEAGT